MGGRCSKGDEDWFGSARFALLMLGVSTDAIFIFLFLAGALFRNSNMSLLLLLLPVALAGLPPHHQKLVDRFGAENVNFDKNVRILEKISRYKE